MFNENINICLSSNGHYAVEILPKKVCNFDNIEQVLIFEDDDNNKKKQSKLTKLHNQFGHASSNNLKSLLKNASYIDKEIYKMVDEISDNCNICKKHKMASPRPGDSLPRATDFNQSVAIDVHYLDNICN